MQYQILVTQQAENSFLATALGFPHCSAEATTKELAVVKAKAALETLLAHGEIVTVEVASSAANPWLALHGQLQAEPLFDDFVTQVNAYRQALDEQEAK